MSPARPPSALADLARLRSPVTRALFASADELYGDAVFGRDSLEAAEDIGHVRPDLARDVILTLARLQGTVDADTGTGSSEEERGKIHHEHRSLHVDGRRISARSQQLLERLSELWGGDGTTMTYYGSADATPLFVRLVASHCRLHGPSLLDEGVVRKDGVATTVLDCTLAALDWITGRMDESPLGLVEFRRRNPNGIPFQVWKDSTTSYLRRDGRIANCDAPIAALEVQGYAYDALTAAARLLCDRHPDLAAEWRERARRLCDRTLQSCWMPADRYFAMGLDRDTGDRPRQIDSIASNAALLLDTSMFDEIEDADRYVSGVVERICSAEFLTEAGVRCRSLGEDASMDFQDYHGTWAVWMKETFDVARGLRRQGLPRLARQVGVRLLNAVNVAGANVEFLYVSPDHRVGYDFRCRDVREPSVEIAATNVPEEGQAWTVTAALALKWLFGSNRWPPVAPPPPTRSGLEERVLRQVPHLDLLRSNQQLRTAYERRGDFVLNRELGLARDRAAHATRRDL
jgi:glycogen debranching enzyme